MTRNTSIPGDKQVKAALQLASLALRLDRCNSGAALPLVTREHLGQAARNALDDHRVQPQRSDVEARHQLADKAERIRQVASVGPRRQQHVHRRRELWRHGRPHALEQPVQQADESRTHALVQGHTRRRPHTPLQCGNQGLPHKRARLRGQLQRKALAQPRERFVRVLQLGWVAVGEPCVDGRQDEHQQSALLLGVDHLPSQQLPRCLVAIQAVVHG